MKLATIELKERHDWIVIVRDDFYPKGTVGRVFSTKEEAEKWMQGVIDSGFVTRFGEPEKEIPEWP